MRVHLQIALVALFGLGSVDAGADVYILKKKASSSSSMQSVPREIARHILLQRASSHYHDCSLSDLPSSTDLDTAVDYISRFGKQPTALFDEAEKPPAQLMVFLEGVTDQNAAPLREILADRLAFTVDDPPSATANSRLFSTFGTVGVKGSQACTIESAVHPYDRTCWEGVSSVLKYDVAKDPETIPALLENMSRLSSFVSSGDLEATLVLVPESSRHSKHSVWSSADAGRHLVARDTHTTSEHMLLSSDDPSRQQQLSSARAAKKLPACFASARVCEAQTGNCSGHGLCLGRGGETSGCFACRCGSTTTDGPVGRHITHWAGAMCQKEDRSTQFWLLAGSAIALAGVVSFSVGLLFSVGEEELPGVIAAGVSRSK